MVWLRNKKTGGLFNTDDIGKVKVNEKNVNMGDISQNTLSINNNAGKQIARLKYLELNDMNKSEIYSELFDNKRIAVQMVEVDEEYRRRGYATTMFKKLQSKYPNEIIRFGQLEPDGEKLLAKIANITDSELKQGHKRKTYYGTIK